MRALDVGMQQTQVFVRVEYRDVPGKGNVSLEVPSAEFEAGERGVQVGAFFIPWHRVHEYDLIIHQDLPGADRMRDGVRMRARVVLDDGTRAGQTLDVTADRFESSAHAVTMLLDRHVDADAGDLVTQKLSVPWHRVVSVERYSALAEGDAGAEAPARRDLD
jgi:uncharacterized protein (UPF0248 family)